MLISGPEMATDFDFHAEALSGAGNPRGARRAASLARYCQDTDLLERIISGPSATRVPLRLGSAPASCSA
jgi:hypothetical protein